MRYSWNNLFPRECAFPVVFEWNAFAVSSETRLFFLIDSEKSLRNIQVIISSFSTKEQSIKFRYRNVIFACMSFNRFCLFFICLKKNRYLYGGFIPMHFASLIGTNQCRRISKEKLHRTVYRRKTFSRSSLRRFNFADLSRLECKRGTASSNSIRSRS